MSKGNRGGRPPKPTALHQLEGTYNPSRHGRKRASEPQPTGNLDEPPDWLNDSQRDAWHYAIANAPAYLLKKLDREMLAIWCVHADNLRLAVTTQNRLNMRSPGLPLLIRTPAGTAASPYVDVIDKCSKNMFRAATELGFSPAARPRIRLEDDPLTAASMPTAPDRWGELKRFPVIDGGKSR
jgi:P27 family predicted phage terminase small subunit